ncbi:restriction endonuclease subunit S [Fusobacterium polymorphum]|uniref:restriction endonuclease subunit S n=3 Tax=Fusobacterium nucleatum subsp. polymorphum TaxID=76857 RepID=UPI002922E3E4|nr:restriction endonuclease subunit S [Fusobacterium nucleatum]
MNKNIQYKKLTDICEIITGEWGTEIKENSQNIVSVIRTTNFLNNGKIDIQNKELVKREMDKNKIEQKKLKKGDIIIEKSGGSPNQPVGRVVFFNLNSNDIFLCNNFTSILRIKEKINSKYIFYFLRNSYKNNKVLKFQNKTTGIINLKLQDYLNGSCIYLPELRIQNKVVNILDILESILEKNQNYLNYLKELTKSLFTRMFGDIKSNDKNWKIYKFSEKLKISSGGTPSKANKIYWENGTISWIGSNMCNDEIITKNDGKFITEEGLKNSSAKIYKMNTVIVALVGATIGKTGLLKFETSTNQNIAALEIKNMDYSPEFLFFLLQNLYYKFTKLGGDTFKMANLSFIKNLPLISPPIELQNKFAERIEKIEKLKFEIEKSIEESQKLYNSLISKYFDN